jgi:hypothetical protein
LSPSPKLFRDWGLFLSAAANLGPADGLAGVVILIAPRLLNYVVAIYLIVVGLVGLNGIYHFMR